MSEAKEILWNVINSMLAGALVLVGAFSDGAITMQGIIIAAMASAGVALNMFKEYWTAQKDEYKAILFRFI